ncbi:MAG: extracellular solute-binding protein [Aggregatilineales bacterium]
MKKGLSRREMLKIMGATTVAGVAGGFGIPNVSSITPMRALAQTDTIELWTGFGQGRMADAMNSAVEQFMEENPGTEVNHVVVPWGELRDQVLRSVAAGDAPDAFRGWDWIVQTDSAEGVLTPLDDYIEAHNGNLDDFWPGTRDAMTYDGQIFGMSHSTTVRMMFYNKDILREVGIDPEVMPDTLEGWVEMGEAATLLADDGEIERVGFIPTIPGFLPFAWYAAFGGQNFWDAEAGTFNINNPEMLAMFEWLKSFADRYGAENIEAYASTYGGSGFGRQTPDGIYYTGRIAIWALNSYIYNDMGEYGPDVDFGIAPFPSPAGVDGAPGDIEANMYLVPVRSANPEGGFRFANFMTSSKFVALNKSLVDSVMPSRPSLANDPDVEAAAGWLPLARDEILPRSRYYGQFPAYGFLLRTISDDALDRMFFDGADPAEVLQDVQESAERELRR